MLSILPTASWREFRGVPKGKTLNEGAMHFAIVVGTDGQERKCVVKFIDLKTRPGLLCEGLGWMLGQASGANVANFAAVLRVPLAELAQCMQLPSFLVGYHDYPAWCVEVVEGKALSQIHPWIFWLERANCLAAKNTPVIASFDYWADNQDRNYGNVIRAKDGKYVAIDHEILLHEIMYMPFMSFKLNSLLEEAERKLSPNKLHKFKCDMALASSNHANAMAAVGKSGEDFLKKLIPNTAAAINLWQDIEKFLSIRATLGWMSSELGVIV